MFVEGRTSFSMNVITEENELLLQTGTYRSKVTEEACPTVYHFLTVYRFLGKSSISDADWSSKDRWGVDKECWTRSLSVQTEAERTASCCPGSVRRTLAVSSEGPVVTRVSCYPCTKLWSLLWVQEPAAFIGMLEPCSPPPAASFTSYYVARVWAQAQNTPRSPRYLTLTNMCVWWEHCWNTRGGLVSPRFFPCVWLLRLNILTFTLS